MNSYKIFLCLLLVMLPIVGFAQNDGLFIHNNLYQSGNPAYMPEKAFVIGMPLLSNLQINVSSPVMLTDVVSEDKANDEWVLDLGKLENKLSQNSSFYVDCNMDLFYAGFRYERNYFSLGWSYRSISDVWIPEDFVGLRHGNWDEGTNTILQYDIDNMALNTMSFSEIKLGWANEINDQLRIGASLKMLTGGMNVQTVRNNWYVVTSEDLKYVKLSGETSVKTSLPLKVAIDNDGNVDDLEFNNDRSVMSYLVNKNIGFAVDLGVNYKYSDQLELSAYIKDVGFMRWKESPNKFNTDHAFMYKGIYVTPATIDDEDFEFFENLGDSVLDADLQVDSSAYTNYLPQAIYLSSIYHVNDVVQLGAMFKSRFYNEKFYPELTLASSVKPVEWFQGSLSVGFDKNSTAKIGLGMQFDAGPVQMFMQASNLQGFMLDKSKAIGFSFGINFLFAEKRF